MNSMLKKADNFDVRFFAIFLVAASFLFLSSILFYFNTIKVYKANNKAMSLFGYIPVHEVENLLGRSV